MLDITDTAALARALDSPIDPRLKTLLRLRRDQLLAGNEGTDLGDVAQFVVVGPGDTVAMIERTAGYPVVTDPAFEWVEDHGGVVEAVTILSDDGFALVLLVLPVKGVDPALQSLLRRHLRRGTGEAATSRREERSTAP